MLQGRKAIMFLNHKTKMFFCKAHNISILPPNPPTFQKSAVSTYNILVYLQTFPFLNLKFCVVTSE